MLKIWILGKDPTWWFSVLSSHKIETLGQGSVFLLVCLRVLPLPLMLSEFGQFARVLRAACCVMASVRLLAFVGAGLFFRFVFFSGQAQPNTISPSF